MSCALCHSTVHMSPGIFSPDMLLLLLLALLCRARAEWVQISQQHYRKPLDDPRAPYQPLTKLPHTFTEATTRRPPPNNQTIHDHRIQGTIQRVPHLGSVKRVQTEHTHSQNAAYIKHTKDQGDDHDKLTLSLDKLNNGFITKDHADELNVHLTELLRASTTRKPLKILRKEPVSTKRNPFITSTRKTTKKPLTENRLPFKSTNKVYVGIDGTQQQLTINPDDVTTEGSSAETTLEDHGIILKKYDIVQHSDLPFITKQSVKQDEKEYGDKINKRLDKLKNEIGTTSETNRKVDVTQLIDKDQEVEQKTKEPPTRNSDKVESSANETKTNTMGNVLKFLKVVTDTISLNTKRNFESKIKYLKNLKNTILGNIELRIQALWPDEGSRRARSRRTARGHVDFPSSEGALMSISFLTFAVFLIKLVLQVIQKYKNNAYMMTPAVMATVRHAAYAHSAPDDMPSYD